MGRVMGILDSTNEAFGWGADMGFCREMGQLGSSVGTPLYNGIPNKTKGSPVLEHASLPHMYE